MKTSWRNRCLVSVSGWRDQLAHWSTTWGPAPSFQHRECSSLSPQRGHFLLCGDLTFPGLPCSLPCVLLFSSKLYPRVCKFWKLLSHITKLILSPWTALCPCTSPFPMSYISSKTLFWVTRPFPLFLGCGCDSLIQGYRGAEAKTGYPLSLLGAFQSLVK